MKQCLFIVSLFMLWVQVSATTRFMVVIDAGSTGTRTFLYKVTVAKSQKIPTLEELLEQHSQHAISIQTEAAIADILSSLQNFDETLTQMRIDKASVATYLFATAGMRHLPPDAAATIYRAVSEALKGSGYRFEEARTISGEEEAVFGWLAVNYLKHRFQDRGDMVVDLGGASVEMTAIKAMCSKDDSYRFEFPKHTYCLSPKSYLNLGEVDVLHNNYVEACYPKDFPMRENRIGRFDYLKCQLQMDGYLATFHLPKLQDATLKHLDGISGVYYIMSFYGVSAIDALQKEAKTLCENLDWSSWVKRYPRENRNYLSQYCAAAVYLERLMVGTKGLGLDPSTKIDVYKKIEGIDVDWPVGAVFYKAYFDSHEEASK